jgi:O-antigen ligase
MEYNLEGLYLLILMLITWGISFVLGVMVSSEAVMVFFFWFSSIIILIVYAFLCKKNNKNMTILKKELILLTPIWLFLIYQSYITLRNVQMSSAERWALIPFVLGLGFYVALLKQDIEKKGKKLRLS